MIERHPNTRGVLYLVVCAAPPAQQVQEFVILAQAAPWDVCVIATPQARHFIDQPLLEKLTGYPVRSEYKTIGTPDVLPKMDAMAVAPMTLNTLTKLADGHADTLALSQLCKGLGLRLPLIVAPCITAAFAHHPAFSRSVAVLQECGVHVLYDTESFPAPKIVPWKVILDELNEMYTRHNISEKADRTVQASGETPW